jgi:putative phosphoribosyl transferase
MIDGVKSYFKDRDDAAMQLLKILPIDKMSNEPWMILSISPNGMSIAKILAEKLNAKCSIIFSQKILAPLNKDCEIAIVTESQEVVIHEELVKSFEIELDYIFDVAKKLNKNVISKMVEEYKNNQILGDLSNKNVLLVDEGLNSGLTMMACIKTAINLQAKSVSVAVPVIPDAIINDIESIADDLYFVYKLPHFVSIKSYYENLPTIQLENLPKGNICL